MCIVVMLASFEQLETPSEKRCEKIDGKSSGKEQEKGYVSGFGALVIDKCVRTALAGLRKSKRNALTTSFPSMYVVDSHAHKLAAEKA